MERRLAVHARAYRQVVAIASIVALVAATASTVRAAPKKAEAKAAFDRGVKAYTDGDYPAASAALGESYGIEADPETLFAWAQSERKLEHCDKAIELWTRLGKFDLPKENRAAIDQKIDDCKQLLAKQKPVEPPPEPTPEPGPAVTPPIDDVAPTPTPTPTPRHDTGHRSRWKDPIGLTLVGLGVAGLATGSVFMVQARSADKAKDDAGSYDEFLAKRDRAESRGKLGVIGLAAGGALLAGGLVWIFTRPKSQESPITGWINAGGGGLVYTSGF